jgi:carboxypeptidase PM20D1
VIGDPQVEIKLGDDDGAAGPSPVTGEIPEVLAELTKATWPGIPVIPTLANGATDSRFLRARGVSAYGFNPLMMYEKDLTRAHGIDERIPIASIAPALDFQYRLVMKLAGP